MSAIIPPAIFSLGPFEIKGVPARLIACLRVNQHAGHVLGDDGVSLMACHSAVRAGDRLAPDEIVALLEQRQRADDANHCPHGRPTALLCSRLDLEKQFRRV